MLQNNRQITISTGAAAKRPADSKHMKEANALTRSDLEKYHGIVVRLKILKTTVVTDSVVGSSPNYPYVAHSVTLLGVRCDDATLREVNELERKKAALDSYIDGTEDERVKTLLDMHYRKNRSWARIASDTGYSMDSNKKYLQRYFKSPHLSPRVPL